jgi:hypothetical protein
MTTLPTQYAYTREIPGHQTGGIRVQEGDLLHDSRGETWTFESVSRQAYGNSTGRVLVSAACGDGLTPCAHAWHINGIERREFFPHVFNLYLGLENGEEA